MKNTVCWMLCLMLSVTLFGCGNDDEPEEAVILEKSSVSIFVGETCTIKFAKAAPSKCKTYSDNDFVADAIIRDGKLEIEGRKMGTANIMVEQEGSYATCKVEVMPKRTVFGSPCLKFGIDIMRLREELGEELPMNLLDGGSFYVVSNHASIHHYYYFKPGYYGTGELECVVTETSGSKENIALYLNERCNLINSSERLYQRPGEYLAKISVKGWDCSIIYAQTKSIIEKYERR